MGGHIVFIMLHILACLFGCFGLFVTIPLHLIYTVLVSNKKKEHKRYKKYKRRQRDSENDFDFE